MPITTDFLTKNPIVNPIIDTFQKTIKRHGDAQWIASINGFYDALPYLQETGSEVIKSDLGSGLPATDALRLRKYLAKRYSSSLLKLQLN